jgi:hypothetical protein
MDTTLFTAKRYIRDAKHSIQEKQAVNYVKVAEFHAPGYLTIGDCFEQFIVLDDWNYIIIECWVEGSDDHLKVSGNELGHIAFIAAKQEIERFRKVLLYGFRSDSRRRRQIETSNQASEVLS